MEFYLNKEQISIQNAIREFTEKEITPRSEEMENTGRLPDDLIKKMAEINLLGMNLPNEFGGAGLDPLDCLLAIEQLSYSGTAAWWLPAFCSSIPECILLFGTNAQKEKYLPPVSAGLIYPSIQFTEADTGSNPDALTTTALPSGNHYSIKGMKRFSSFGARDGYAVLYAKDESGKCTAFIVEKNVQGYNIGEIYQLMGSGGSEPADIYYDNVEVPKNDILGNKGRGMDILRHWISDEKIQQCGACLGIAQAALDEAIYFSKNRMVGKRPQSALQGIRWMLAEMHSKLTAARSMTYRAAFLKAKSDKHWIREAAATKLFVVPATMEIVEMSRRIHGSYSYIKGYKIEQLVRAIAGSSAIAVSLEINKTIVGSSLL